MKRCTNETDCSPWWILIASLTLLYIFHFYEVVLISVRKNNIRYCDICDACVILYLIIYYIYYFKAQ